MMQVLLVIDCLGPGGAQRQLVNLALYFREKGHSVSFLIYHNVPFYNNILEEQNINIHLVNENNYFRRLYKMRRYIRNGNYDAVISFLEASNFICEVAGLPFRKWKLIVGERSANPDISRSWKLILYRWFHVLADFVVANSIENMYMVRKINRILPAGKCRVIYNMVDFTKWQTSQKYIFKSGNKFKLIIAASHLYLKNLNGLIEAVRLLSTEEKNLLSIVWYGDRITEPFYDSSFIEAKMKINKYGLDDIFTFYPACHQLNNAVSMADGVGLFSFHEGFPNFISEGMSCKKPAICSRISDVPLFIQDQPLLCEACSPGSISKSISYLINLNEEEIKKIGETNYDTANKNFNPQVIGDEYLEMILN